MACHRTLEGLVIGYWLLVIGYWLLVIGSRRGSVWSPGAHASSRAVSGLWRETVLVGRHAGVVRTLRVRVTAWKTDEVIAVSDSAVHETSSSILMNAHW